MKRVVWTGDNLKEVIKVVSEYCGDFELRYDDRGRLILKANGVVKVINIGDVVEMVKGVECVYQHR